MNLSSIINIDNPYCIYCQSVCEIEMKDYSFGRINSSSIRHTFDCYICEENFQIDFFQEKETGYTFTCKDFEITYSKSRDETLIYYKLSFNPVLTFKKELSVEHPNDLYNKFKTYLMLA